MPEVLSKSAFARRIGVDPAAVSNWIRRQRLTAPALRADGKIDAERAAEQLGRTLGVVHRTGAQSIPDLGAAAGEAELPEMRAVQGAQQQLLRARALSASVDAMKKRRDFMAESGKYMMTQEAEAAWGRVLSDFLLMAEHSFPDLAAALQSAASEREKVLVLRRWWRNLRIRAAEHNQSAGEALTEFVEDSAA